MSCVSERVFSVEIIGEVGDYITLFLKRHFAIGFVLIMLSDTMHRADSSRGRLRGRYDSSLVADNRRRKYLHAKDDRRHNL